MSSFEFGTKAETLERIKPLLSAGKVLDKIYFSLDEWEKNDEELLDLIQQKFNSDLIVVRSSSINEDTNHSSMAGKYKSVLNVSKNNKENIKTAIEIVRKSYMNDRQQNPKDQILVQPQLINIIMSGVMFTRCKDSGAPYFIINYDDISGRTDSVTSGNSSNLKTFNYFKFLDKLPSNTHLAGLVKLAKELEGIIGIDHLDIEFAINSDGIYVLQVRPLTTLREIERPLDHEVSKTIENIKNFIRANDKKFPNLQGYKAIFGLMPDWNPAEIIGESPKPLAFSLYKEIITDYIWPLSRNEIGYKDVGYHPGVVSLGGKPYVDVRLSFNTFVPEAISETTAEKLVNFYIDKLINNPEMHDKIEFKIALTCYKFGFEKEEQELKQNNFSPLQIKEIKNALKELTNNIVGESYTSIEKELKLNEVLNEKINKITNSDIEYDVKIAQLIHCCKYYGTLPFSKLARFAFVGNILLSSLVECGMIPPEEKDKFFKSINSVAIDFLRKLNMLKKKQITKQDFLEQFGHLRPGTYDLCSGTYKECFEDYFNIENSGDHFQEPLEFNFDQSIKNKIEEQIKKEELAFSGEQFLSFTKRALAAREKSKFEFTKALSLILDYCYECMRKYGFTKEETTFLEIEDIISFAHKSRSISELEDLKDKIEKNQKQYKIMKALRLPPLVYMERNVEYFHHLDNKPNFVTQKSINGEIIELTEKMSPTELNGKIVLITSADPGYDWVFGYNLKGLITKYGGVASHMSIRCAEFGLPAAVGCGETIYNYIKGFKNIELNCAAKQIKGIL